MCTLWMDIDAVNAVLLSLLVVSVDFGRASSGSRQHQDS